MHYTFTVSMLYNYTKFYTALLNVGDRGSTVVKVLCYKSEGSIPACVGIFH
jgi:hypothetical protein